MKKWICMLLILCFLVICAGCRAGDTADSEEEPVNGITGTVIRFDRVLDIVTITTQSGEEYALLVDDSTELIWADEESFEDLGESVPDNNDWRSFQPGLEVCFVLGEEADASLYSYAVTTQLFYHGQKIVVTAVNDSFFEPIPTEFVEATYAKPVIYLYPETKTDITVKLDYEGQLTCTYPTYSDGWSVTAYPDGTLVDQSGQSYNYLYWEGEGAASFDFSRGFCVAGADTAAFLEDALDKLWFSCREANEFIVYWLPLMEANPYNLISFQTDSSTDHAELEISPAPDTLIRVFMAWKPLESAVDIPAQNLTAPERDGFTVIEWGGSQVE